MPIRHLVFMTLFSLCCHTGIAQEVIPLWDSGAPGSEARMGESEEAESYWVKNVHTPSITAFLPSPEDATGAAVVICPGGGHRLLVFNAEGVEAAKFLQSKGIAAFALKYRLGREENSPYQIEKHALMDGQRAVQLVRSRAEDWNIDPARVGMLGFSAGGEVVSMVAYAQDSKVPDDPDPVAQQSSLLNYQLLVYPGPIGIPDQIEGSAPPAFLLVANDDGAARNIVDLLSKFRAAKVPVEAHIYARGGHAFNMGNRTQLKTISDWPARMLDWMHDNQILDPELKIEK